ncbi:MAG: type II secretion protein F [Streptosporangiales bacterium]|nr:type II secretion protein F [Streptosporangiales bacterium]
MVAKAGAVGLLVAVALGGATGAVAGIGVGYASFRLLANAEPKEVRARRARLRADLPVAIDLLAACLLAGRGPAEATAAVAAALPGPLGDRLRTVAESLLLGAEPEAAWSALAADPELAGLARTIVRAARTGAPPAAALDRLAEEQRALQRTRASAAAQRAGVLAVIPLGLCFLPAFVLIGIVPLAAGLLPTGMAP